MSKAIDELLVKLKFERVDTADSKYHFFKTIKDTEYIIFTHKDYNIVFERNIINKSKIQKYELYDDTMEKYLSTIKRINVIENLLKDNESE